MRWTRYDYVMVPVCTTILVASLIAGCKTDSPVYEGGGQVPPMLYVDPTTGCQYLRTSSYGITPRLNIEGRPMCGTVIEKSAARVEKTT